MKAALRAVNFYAHDPNVLFDAEGLLVWRDAGLIDAARAARSAGLAEFAERQEAAQLRAREAAGSKAQAELRGRLGVVQSEDRKAAAALAKARAELEAAVISGRGIAAAREAVRQREAEAEHWRFAIDTLVLETRKLDLAIRNAERAHRAEATQAAWDDFVARREALEGKVRAAIARHLPALVRLGQLQQAIQVRRQAAWRAAGGAGGRM